MVLTAKDLLATMERVLNEPPKPYRIYVHKSQLPYLEEAIMRSGNIQITLTADTGRAESVFEAMRDIFIEYHRWKCRDVFERRYAKQRANIKRRKRGK